MSKERAGVKETPAFCHIYESIGKKTKICRFEEARSIFKIIDGIFYVIRIIKK